MLTAIKTILGLQDYCVTYYNSEPDKKLVFLVTASSSQNAVRKISKHLIICNGDWVFSVTESPSTRRKVK